MSPELVLAEVAVLVGVDGAVDTTGRPVYAMGIILVRQVVALRAVVGTANTTPYNNIQ